MEEMNMAANAEPVVETSAEGIATPDTSAETNLTEATEQPAAQEPQAEQPQQTDTQRVAERIKQVREQADREKQAALDEFSQAAYGMPYADYLEAKRNAEYQDKYGVTADALQPMVDELVSNHPAVREAEQFRLQQAQDWAVKQFQEQLPELGVKTFDDLLTLPDYDQIRAMMGANVHPVKAYRALHFDELVESRTKQAQQDQLKKINANGAASPGSLAHAPDSEPFFTEEQVRRMTAKEYLDNRDAVLKSRQKWKKG